MCMRGLWAGWVVYRVCLVWRMSPVSDLSESFITGDDGGEDLSRSGLVRRLSVSASVESVCLSCNFRICLAELPTYLSAG